jgi:hypothetical protein
MGGMIWGLGAARLEKTDIDLRHARYVNDNISEYRLPVNKDGCSVEVMLVPEGTTADPPGDQGPGRHRDRRRERGPSPARCSTRRVAAFASCRSALKASFSEVRNPQPNPGLVRRMTGERHE